MINFNNVNLLLSVGASFVAIMTGIVALTRFLTTRFLSRRPSSPLSYGGFSQTGYIGAQSQQKGVGYYFGCLLQTIISIVIIISVSTVFTYLAIILFYLFYVGTHQPGTYP
jgi:hypothetical protein